MNYIWLDIILIKLNPYNEKYQYNQYTRTPIVINVILRSVE